jgi:hypothetical protein
MTVEDQGFGGENTDRDAGGAVHKGEGVSNSDLDDAAMLQCDNRSATATSTTCTPESDSGATLDEERWLHPPLPGESIVSPCGERSRSPSGSDRAYGSGRDWVFDVFAEDDSGTKGVGSPSSKRARSSSRRSEAAEKPPSQGSAFRCLGAHVTTDDHGRPGIRGPSGHRRVVIGV